MSSRPLAVLIGSPGAGKTTVGWALAERLGVDLLDTDAEIERRAGKTVSDIFVEDGEEAFRALEREVVAEALASHPGVVALGGGAILNEQTRADLAGHRVVYLEVEFADAAKRVGLDTARPLLLGNPRARLKALLRERLPIYQSLATLTVSTSEHTPEEAAELIAKELPAAGD